MILQPGNRAPDFQLPLLGRESSEQTGEAHWQLGQALKGGAALLIFVKESCPTCQFALPLLDRIYQNYPGSQVAVVGIFQEIEPAAKRMVRELSIHMPVLLDEDPYPVSEQYELSFVPTFYYINQEGKIEQVIESFAREELREVNEKVARASDRSPIPFFRPEEAVPFFRPG